MLDSYDMKKQFRIKLDNIPDLLGLVRNYPDKFPALLNSHVVNGITGRYSILFKKSKSVHAAYNISDLNKLLSQFDRKVPETKDGSLPFHSGWFLYLSYASIKSWENKLSEIKHDPRQPLAVAIRCKSAIVIDHIENQAWIVANSRKRMNKLKRLLTLPIQMERQKNNHLSLVNDDVQLYKDNAHRIIEYIKSGDVYQVNLARKWEVDSSEKIDALSLYQSLSEHNPAPFAGFMNYRNFSIISSSPERLIKIQKRVIESRPIAGTRPRGTSKQLDEKLVQELINHPKEQAEHIMLIDLERNDLGRVCKSGSVKVDEFMTVESYKKVHHIVSNIIGKLKKKTSYYDAIKATFPGGTITGCPKIRCMEIIDELENYPRGAYTGSFGYISDDGQMDLNILIRTFTLIDNDLSLHAGAGIVYDSNPEKEAEESMHKAEALINSLE